MTAGNARRRPKAVPFREDWAFASAELTEKAQDGAIERYTWSQWVSLRRP